MVRRDRRFFRRGCCGRRSGDDLGIDLRFAIGRRRASRYELAGAVRKHVSGGPHWSSLQPWLCKGSAPCGLAAAGVDRMRDASSAGRGRGKGGTSAVPGALEPEERGAGRADRTTGTEWCACKSGGTASRRIFRRAAIRWSTVELTVTSGAGDDPRHFAKSAGPSIDNDAHQNAAEVGGAQDVSRTLAQRRRQRIKAGGVNHPHDFIRRYKTRKRL